MIVYGFEGMGMSIVGGGVERNSGWRKLMGIVGEHVVRGKKFEMEGIEYI